MVLPGTWSAALTLLILAAICFALWPNLFKLAGRWRFELFSFDFAAGVLICALFAAFTLGTLGAELNFSDSMLVAGRRAELMAVASGTLFALANMLYLATIALMGLTNGTLLTFGALGFVLSFLELLQGHYLTANGSGLLLAITAALAVASTSAKRTAAGPRLLKQMSPTRKGAITGVLSGITFAGVWPVLQLAEVDQMGIGAYGGVLMAAIGILVSTFFLNFFFLNMSLEGGAISYSTYLTGTAKDHLKGIFCGVVCAAGALALYAACTGVAPVTRFEAWLSLFAGAFLAVISGLLFWQRMPQPPAAKRNTLISTLLYAAGVALLLAGMRK